MSFGDDSTFLFQLVTPKKTRQHKVVTNSDLRNLVS